MPNVRPINEKKYGISKHAFATAYAYCLQYPEWISEIKTLSNTYRSPEVTGMPSSHGNTDSTSDAAMRISELKGKISNVEETVKAAVVDYDALYPYLLTYVTTEGSTFRDMRQQGIPCGHTLFYQIRRKFYYLMAKKI